MSPSNKSIFNLIFSLDQNVRCLICSSYINKPIKNICGHRFCYDCVYALTNPGEKGKLKVKKCPKCCSRLKLLIEDVKFLNVSKKVQTLLPMLDKSFTPNKSFSEEKILKGKPIRLKRVLQDLLSDIEAADSEDYDEDDANDFEDTKKMSGKKYLKKSHQKIKINKMSSSKYEKKIEDKFLASKLTLNEKTFDRELSPFPISFINKFSRKLDNRVKETDNANHILDIDKMKKKIADLGHCSFDISYDNRNDEILHLIHDKINCGKFDKLKESMKNCACTQTDDAKLISEKKNSVNKEQQTNVSFYCSKNTQTDYVALNTFNGKTTMVNQFTATDPVYLIDNSTQAELDCFVNISKNEKSKKSIQTIQLSQSNNFEDVKQEENLSYNIDSVSLSQKKASQSKNDVKEANKTKFEDNENFKDNDLSKKIVFESNNLEGTIKEQISKNVEASIQSRTSQLNNVNVTKEQLDKSVEEIASSQKLFSQFSTSSTANLSIDFSQILEFNNDQATQIYTQTEVNSKDNSKFGSSNENQSKKFIQKRLDLELDSKVNENEVIMESDEEDDFLMRCVFESLNSNDDDINDIESLKTLSPQPSSTKVKTKKKIAKEKADHSKVSKKSESRKFSSFQELRLRI